MDLTFSSIYKSAPDIFKNHSIDLANTTFFDPWAIGMICLKAIEYKNASDKKLILPENTDAISYIKRMHFDKFMNELTYRTFLERLHGMNINERDNLNIHEIMHCDFRDDFSARLNSKIRQMFKNFGMSDADEQRATALVGELGNNVFDHNEGSWPTDVRGAIIVAQHYPKIHKIEVAVADPGVGFLRSLKLASPSPRTHIEAIKLGLRGVTGRIGEPRGNGLQLIQKWTIDNFNGIIRIHSGDGLVIVDQNGQKENVVNPILGTLAELVVIYK